MIADGVIRDPERFVVKIQYDPTYGFPTVIDTDTADPATDGYYRQFVSGFRPIK